MDTQNKRSLSQVTSLIPENTTRTQQGPLGMSMGNMSIQNVSYMTSDLSLATSNLSFPEIDLGFLTQRPVQVKNVTWNTTLGLNDNLFVVNSADILNSPTLKQVLQFQSYYRFDTVLTIVVASVSSSTGALVAYWIPVDYKIPGTERVFDKNAVTMLEHVFIYPYKQSSAVVRGRYIRPSRYNSQPNLGTFVCDIWNILGGASATAAANAIQVTAYVHFENMSMRVPKAVSVASTVMNSLTKEEKEEFKNELLDEDLEVVSSQTSDGEQDPERCGNQLLMPAVLSVKSYCKSTDLQDSVDRATVVEDIKQCMFEKYAFEKGVDLKEKWIEEEQDTRVIVHTREYVENTNGMKEFGIQVEEQIDDEQFDKEHLKFLQQMKEFGIDVQDDSDEESLPVMCAGEQVEPQQTEKPTVEVGDSVETNVSTSVEEPVVVGGVSTDYPGFLNTDHAHLKLSLQRFARIAVIPGVGRKMETNFTNWKKLFKMTQRDLVACYQIAGLYYGYSGGLRLKIVTNATVNTGAIIAVSNAGTNQQFNAWQHTEITVTLPYWERMSVTPLWGPASDTPFLLGLCEIDIIGKVEETFMMTLNLATADDFVLHFPMPSVDYTKMLWLSGVDRDLYVGVPALEMEPKRCGGRKKNPTEGQSQDTGVFTEVVDTIAAAVKWGGGLLGLFDRPDAPEQNEWGIVDQPVKTTRLGFAETDVVKPDYTITGDTRGVDMMHVGNLLAVPLRVKTQDWTTALTHGTVMTSFSVGPLQHRLYDKIKGSIPKVWRGTSILRFEFIKNVFHKGTIAVFFVPKGNTAISTAYTQYYSTVFDISNEDSFEFAVPYANNFDYEMRENSIGEVYLMVVNPLTAQNTSSTVPINVYFSMGTDLELRVPNWQFDTVSNLNTSVTKAGPFSATYETEGPGSVVGEKRKSRKHIGVIRCGKEQRYILYRKGGRVVRDCEESTREMQCSLRNQYTMTQNTVQSRVERKLRRVDVEETDRKCCHLHDSDNCLKINLPVHFTDEQVFDTSTYWMNTLPPLKVLVVDKIDKKRKFVTTKVRYKDPGRVRSVVFKLRDEVVCVELQGRNAWDIVGTVLKDFSFESRKLEKNSDLPERCGGSLTKAGEQFAKGMTNAVEADKIKKHVKTFVDDLGLKGSETYDNMTDTVIVAMMTKLPAYLLQISSLNDVKGYISMLLHLIGDMILALKVQMVVKDMLENLASSLVEVVHVLVTPVSCGGEEEEQAKMSWLKELWKKSKKIVKPILDKSCLSFASFVKYLSPVALLGSVCRGLSYLVDCFKKLLNWFGFCLTRKQRQIKKAREWLLLRQDVTDSKLKEMKGYIVSGNPHAVVTDEVNFERIKSLVRFGLEFENNVSCLDTVDAVKGDLEIVRKFLRKAQELPCDPLKVGGFEPVFILLEGKPGLGKSLMSKKIAKLFAKILAGDENQYYRLTLGQDYWTGCADQNVFVIDDLFQDPTGEGVAQLTQLISCVGFPTPKADISGKFGFSQAKVVVGSSNSAEPTVGALTEKGALIRRYKDTHFHLDRKGWRQVYHSEDNTVTYSTYLSDQEVSVRVQQHFEKKWQKHLELEKEEGFQPLTSLSTLMRKPRIETKMLHHTQTGLVIDVTKIKKDDSHSFSYFTPNDTESDTDPERCAAFTLKHANGTDVDPSQPLGHSLYVRMCSAEGDELVDLINAETDLSETAVTLEDKLGLLGVPYKIKSLEPLVIEGDLGRFAKWIYSGNMTDKRDVLALCIANEKCEDVLAVGRALQMMVQTQSSKFRKILQGIKNKLRDYKVSIGVLGILGGLSGAALMLYLSTGVVDEASSYEGRTYRQMLTSRLVRAKPMDPVRTGKEDNMNIIRKSILGWTFTAGNGKPYTMNCLSLGQGYVLVTKHGVRIGGAHSIITEDGGVKKITPVHVSETTVMQFVCGENEKQDLCLVWLGSTIPLRKSIVGHLLTQAQLNTLDNTEARCVKPVGNGRYEETVGMIKWTERQWIRSSSLGERIIQSCFVGDLGIKIGDCGSPLLCEKTGLESKIIGIASAGGNFKSVFLPITREAVLSAMDTLGSTIKDTTVEFCGSATMDLLDNQRGNARAQKLMFEGCEKKIILPEEQAQFVGLVNAGDEMGRVSLTTKIVSTEVDTSLLGPILKFPAIKNMHRSENPLELRTGSVVDGTILTNKLEDRELDSPKLEKALAIMSEILDYITPCEVLTEHEVLNNYSRAELNNDFVIESNGINNTSASGHYMDKNFSKKPRGFWILEVPELGIRKLGKEVREHVQQIESSILSGVVPDTVIEMHFKDELRAVDKIEKGRCRIFYVQDMALWYLQKKYFGDFISKYRTGKGFLGKHAVGCDPVVWFNGWGQELKKRPVVSTDVSGWDTSITGFHLEFVRCLVEECYPTSTPEERMARKCLIDMMSWSHCLLEQYQFVASGMKSGTFATTEFNSIIHTIVLVYCLLDILPTPTDVLRWPFLTLGDDGLLALPNLAQSTSKSLVRGYKEMGFKMTGHTKIDDALTTTIEEVVFLKRRFHPVEVAGETFYVPRMEFSTIQSLMYYRKKTVDPYDNFLDALVFARQGMDYEIFRKLNYTYAIRATDAMKTWQEVGGMYEGNPEESRFHTPVWEWKGGFGVPWLYERHYAKLRLVEGKKQSREAWKSEIVECLRNDTVFPAVVWASELDLEFPYFTAMKRMLEHEGIFVFGDYYTLCCLWWYFCWQVEYQSPWDLISLPEPKLSGDRLLRTRYVLDDCELTHWVRSGGKGLRGMIDEMVSSFPGSRKMAWWALMHMHRTWATRIQPIDMCSWMCDLLPLGGFGAPPTDVELDELDTFPVRLPISEDRVSELSLDEDNTQLLFDAYGVVHGEKLHITVRHKGPLVLSRVELVLLRENRINWELTEIEY